MRTIYVLKLTNNKYYIGQTSRPLQNRVLEHFNKNGSEWTKLYRPIDILEEKIEADEIDEDRYTKIYMKKYGIDNVRGGSYTQVILPLYKMQSLQDELCTANNLCFYCNQYGHYINLCPLRLDHEEYGELLNNTKFCDNYKNQNKTSYKNQKETDCCFRCGRNGHWANACYASYHNKGYKLK